MADYENQNKKIIGSWDQWAIHVIETLRSCEKSNKDLAEKIDSFSQEFIIHKTKVETKAVVVGSISAIAVSAIVSLILFFLEKS
jgi:hypothetical protein